MHIELSQTISSELCRRAAAVDVSSYAEALLLTTTEPAMRTDGQSTQPYTVGEWRGMLERSDATSGRNGRPWRELIHDGHKY